MKLAAAQKPDRRVSAAPYALAEALAIPLQAESRGAVHVSVDAHFTVVAAD